MKTKLSVNFLFALLITFSVIWSAAAEGPPAQNRSPEKTVPFKQNQTFNAQELEAAAVGQPSTVFRYVQTFGVVGMPYFADTTHLNRPEGLFMDSSGNLYVTEEQGRRLLRYNSSKSNTLALGKAGVGYTDDYVFSYPMDAALDGSGNIWVADSSRVVQYDTNGVFLQQQPATDPWESGDDNERFNETRGIAFDSAGRMYVSDSNNHRIQVYDFAGGSPVYSTTIGVTGESGSDNAHFDNPYRIALDSSDRLYVADRYNGRVQSCTFSSSWTCSPIDSGLNNPQGLALDNSDNLYIADTENSRIRKCTSGGVCSDFVTDTWWLSDLAVDSSGNVYGSTSWGATILYFDSTGNDLGVYLGEEKVPYVTDSTHYNHPRIAIDNADNIIVVEENGQRLIKLNANGVPQWAVGAPGLDTNEDNDHFNWPHGVAVDNNGKIYVADYCRVQIFNSNGIYANTLGGPDCGTGDYEFDWAAGIAVANNGNIYVSDANNHRVQIYDSNLDYLNHIGVTGDCGSDNTHLCWPIGLEVDSAGNIYVADAGNARVQKFNSSRVWQKTLGITGDGGSEFSQFDSPEDIAIDAQNRIYVADMWNNRVQVFDSAGAYLTTIDGEWGSHTGELRGASSVDVDSQGNVYVTDFDNGRIKKYTPSVSGWTQVNINGFGKRWAGGITALEPFNGQLYAAAANWDDGVQVWRASSPWTTISQPGFGSAYTTTNRAVGDMIEFNGQLYAGAGWSDDPGQIWRFNGSNWTQVEGNGFGNGNSKMLAPFGVFSSWLYVSAQNTTDGLEIRRSDTGNNDDWDSIITNGDGKANNTAVTGFMEFNGYLYAAVENEGDGAEIWRTSNGTTWSSVQSGGFGDPDNTQTGGFAILGSYLYIGTRNDTTGAQIWRSNGTTWAAVMSNGFGDGNNAKVESLITLDDTLYAVTGNDMTGVEVWHSTDGTTWQQINVDGWGDSNNEATLWSSSTAVLNDTLYIGTWNWGNGGEVWALDSGQSVFLPVVVKNQ